MALSIKQMQALQIFAQTRNVTTTARLLNVSQPAVSHMLREIEAYFGFETYYRSGGQMNLTTEAEAVLPEIDRILEDTVNLERRLDRLRHPDPSAIAIAGMSAMISHVLPEAVTRFRRRRPQVHFNLLWLPRLDVIRQVRDQAVDLGFLPGPIDDSDIDVREIWHVPLACVSPQGHRFGRQSAVAFADLQGETLIGGAANTPSGLLMRSYFDEAELKQLLMMETNVSQSAIELVRQGAGVALINPLSHVERDSDGLQYTPISPALNLRIMRLQSKHRQPSLLVLDFLTDLHETIVGHARSIEKMGIRTTVL